MTRVLLAVVALAVFALPCVAETASTLTFETHAVVGRVAPGSASAWMRMSARRSQFGS